MFLEQKEKDLEILKATYSKLSVMELQAVNHNFQLDSERLRHKLEVVKLKRQAVTEVLIEFKP